MIQNESLVKVVDNTWAITAKVIRVLKWSNARYAYLWDKVVLAVKSARPGEQVKKWDIVKWVLVRSRKETRRKDGTYVRFEDNAVVLVNNDWNPRGKRIFWPIAREVREKWYYQIAKLAEEVI